MNETQNLRHHSSVFNSLNSCFKFCTYELLILGSFKICFLTKNLIKRRQVLTRLLSSRRTLTMPSHFWYLLAFRAYMLRVVLADSDLLSGILIFFFNHFFKSPNYFCSSNVLSQKDLPLLFNRQNVTDSTVKIRFL